MTEKHVCPICGEETSSYMGNYRKDGLCKKHATDLKNHKLKLCNQCGKVHEYDKPCSCEKPYTELPNTGFDKCLICGKETKGYAFCRKCFKEHTEEELLKILNNQNNEHLNKTSSTTDEVQKVPSKVVVINFNKKAKSITDNGQADNPCACEEKLDTNNKCIVCGKDAPNGSLCRDCYSEMLNYKDSLDKNAQLFEIKDYYFNLRYNIYRIKSFEYIKSNCNKLFALATLAKEIYNDKSLTDRIIKDITDIIEKKTPQKELNSAEQEQTVIEDSRKVSLVKTTDGHYVKSEAEKTIDNLLYELRIAHCYEKQVLLSSDEQAIFSDWFIPVLDCRRGIYIEYWGMNTSVYLKNKERKQQAYKTHNIPLIEIEKDDYKDQNFEYRLVDEINKLAYQYFEINNFIKLNK